MFAFPTSITRLRFFAATPAAALTAGTASCVSAQTTGLAAVNREPYRPYPLFPYEVGRSDAEWRTLLNAEEYSILREGKTEAPESSPLWQETRNGSYSCKSCDLKVYDSRWKTTVDKGWVFFHAEPNAVMTDIDGPNPAHGMAPQCRYRAN